jgi:predicted glycoside hydrolase/deacetylase ChbG (UPF0249 family)
MKRVGLLGIGVCADDFGLDAAINEATLELAAAGRVSALACMTTAAAWPSGARHLRRDGFGARVDIGLHLNLTEVVAPGHWQRPLAPLVLSACLRMLPRAAIRAEVEAQLDAFDDQLGRAPDFVDGHQHVHQLPQVRELLVAALLARYPKRRPWWRNTRPPLRRRVDGRAARKQRLIAALGATRLTALAGGLGFAQNSALVGVYGFDASPGRYRALLQTWLDELGAHGAGGLLMCHPAASLAGADPIAAARRVETVVLGGADFPTLLAERGLFVARPSELLPGCAGRLDRVLR